VEIAKRRRHEVLLVLGLSLGQSAVYAIVSLIAKLTKEENLSSQAATLNPSQAPGRPYLDLTLQLLSIFFALVAVGLAYHLLGRDPGKPRLLLGFDRPRPLIDLGGGAALAAAIGIPGLLLYVIGHAIGINARVIPAALPAIWWGVPVLILSAIENAIVEEVIVVGYLITRLRQLRWRPAAYIAASAVLRGSYHLYQGFGAFIGNAVMGVVFALVFLRTRRVAPLIVAHSLLDIVAFVGYDLFGNHLSFLR
jgi:membrane protease YdiL (CAAX protease family)